MALKTLVDSFLPQREKVWNRKGYYCLKRNILE